MPKDDKTTHDLADELERAAKALRSAPPFPITAGTSKTRVAAKGSANVVSESKAASHAELSLLADRLQTIDAITAEPQIRALPVNDARHLARILGLRVASKATKDETIALLLSQLYEVPAGQERLRTFHERNRG